MAGTLANKRTVGVIGALMLVLAVFIPLGAVLFGFGWVAILLSRDRATVMLGVACTSLAFAIFVLKNSGATMLVTDFFGS